MQETSALNQGFGSSYESTLGKIAKISHIK